MESPNHNKPHPNDSDDTTLDESTMSLRSVTTETKPLAAPPSFDLEQLREEVPADVPLTSSDLLAVINTAGLQEAPLMHSFFDAFADLSTKPAQFTLLCNVEDTPTARYRAAVHALLAAYHFHAVLYGNFFQYPMPELQKLQSVPDALRKHPICIVERGTMQDFLSQGVEGKEWTFDMVFPLSKTLKLQQFLEEPAQQALQFFAFAQKTVQGSSPELGVDVLAWGFLERRETLSLRIRLFGAPQIITRETPPDLRWQMLDGFAVATTTNTTFSEVFFAALVAESVGRAQPMETVFASRMTEFQSCTLCRNMKLISDDIRQCYGCKRNFHRNCLKARGPGYSYCTSECEANTLLWCELTGVYAPAQEMQCCCVCTKPVAAITELQLAGVVVFLCRTCAIQCRVKARDAFFDACRVWTQDAIDQVVGVLQIDEKTAKEVQRLLLKKAFGFWEAFVGDAPTCLTK